MEELDYASYRDDYVEKLTKVIQAKVDGEEIVQVLDVEDPKIINLMDALKESVARAQAGVAAADEVEAKPKPEAKPKAAKKKMAPSAKPAAKKATRRKKSR